MVWIYEDEEEILVVPNQHMDDKSKTKRKLDKFKQDGLEVYKTVNVNGRNSITEKGLEITLAKACSETKMETLSNIGNESAANIDYSHTSLKEKRQQIPPSKEVPDGYEEINGILYLVQHTKVIKSCNSDETKNSQL